MQPSAHIFIMLDSLSMSSSSSASSINPFHHPGGWTLRRSLFKAFCWALDGLLVFAIFTVGFESALKHFKVAATPRYAMVAIATAVSHQYIYPAFERLQTVTTKRAIPLYRGNWWLNFVVADHLSNEITSFIVVGGIQALCALWVIESTLLSVTVLMMLEPFTFFLWALAEDSINILVLRRSAEAEEYQYMPPGCKQRAVTAFAWSLKRLFTRELWLYNLASITIKAVSTFLTYWAGDQMLLAWAGSTGIADAAPEIRALVAFVKIVIFFETFLFFGIRCPDAVLETIETSA